MTVLAHVMKRLNIADVNYWKEMGLKAVCSLSHLHLFKKKERLQNIIFGPFYEFMFE